MLLGAGPLNYDGSYALLWGSQLAEGVRPDVQVPLAPTPKPLLIALAAMLDAIGFGHSAEPALLALSVASLGCLAAAVGTVAWRLAGCWAGALAVAVIVTREPVVSWALRGYSEVLFCALLVTVLALELRHRRAGTAGVLLLSIAGLLRPEAWLLSIAYLAWCWPTLRPGHRAALAALACTGPLTWMVFDLVASGVPWWSLTGTRETAAMLDRPTGVDALVLVAPRRIGEILREPVLAGAAAGLVLMVARPKGGARPMLAGIGAVSLAFATLAIAGLPVIARYLLPVAALLAIVASVAVVDLLGRDRPLPMRAAGVALAGWMAVSLPGQLHRLTSTARVLTSQRAIASELHVLADSGQLGSSCGPLSLPNHRALPSIAWWTSVSPYALRADAHGPPTVGSVLVPGPVARRLYVLDRRDPVTPAAGIPDGFAVRGRGQYWSVIERCPAVR